MCLVMLTRIKSRAEQARQMADSAAKLERDFAWVATEKVGVVGS
jgi:hypothetical protein